MFLLFIPVEGERALRVTVDQSSNVVGVSSTLFFRPINEMIYNPSEKRKTVEQSRSGP
jgi:hypothetical protein